MNGVNPGFLLFFHVGAIFFIIFIRLYYMAQLNNMVIKSIVQNTVIVYISRKKNTKILVTKFINSIVIKCMNNIVIKSMNDMVKKSIVQNTVIVNTPNKTQFLSAAIDKEYIYKLHIYDSEYIYIYKHNTLVNQMHNCTMNYFNIKSVYIAMFILKYCLC